MLFGVLTGKVILNIAKSNLKFKEKIRQPSAINIHKQQKELVDSKYFIFGLEFSNKQICRELFKELELLDLKIFVHHHSDLGPEYHVRGENNFNLLKLTLTKYSDDIKLFIKAISK